MSEARITNLTEREREEMERVTADAVAAIPSGPGASVATERVVDLCRRIYSKNLTLDESYATLTDAMYSRWATQAMRAAAIKIHGRRLARQVS